MTIEPCPNCDRRFDSERKLRIHHTRVHGEQLPNRSCAFCGTEFYADYPKKYCSRSCYHEDAPSRGRGSPNFKSKRTKGTCRLCNSQFEYYPSAKRGLYCPECVKNESWRTTPRAVGEDNPQWNGGKRSVECTVCRTVVKRYPSNIGTVTVCSEACRSTWLSGTFTGDGHPNWKGGGNGAYGKGWNSVRRQALERDGYRCVVCGTSQEELGRNPDVHHIIPVRWFIESDEHTREDAHYLENVISLCIGCHRKADFGKISRDDLRTRIGSEDATGEA